MKLASAIIPLFLATTLSQQVNAVELVNVKEFPEWLQEALAREKKVKKKSKLKLEEFNVNSKVKGKLKLINKSDGTWYYNIDIGTNTPIECYVLSTFDGPANSLYALIELSLSGIEKLNKQPLINKFNYAIDSNVIGHTPYLQLDTLYMLGDGKSKVSGLLKGLSAETSKSLQVCLHNEAGYNDAFFNVFTSFVEAFQKNEERPQFFENIVQMSINGMPIGYSLEQFAVDNEGDVNEKVKTSILMPVDASSIARSDSLLDGWSSADGSLINAISYTIDNSGLTSNFSLKPVDNKWVVSGTLQGKEIKKDLEYKDWLMSGFGSYMETVSLGQSDDKASEFYMWSADADPTVAMKVVLSKVTDNPEANFNLNMGPFALDYMAKANGIIEKGTLEQGGLKLNLESLYVNGEPKLP